MKTKTLSACFLALAVAACTATVPPPTPGSSVPGEISPFPSASTSTFALPSSTSTSTSPLPTSTFVPQTQAPTPSTEPAPTPEPAPEPTPETTPPAVDVYSVLSVYDGDTLRVRTPDGSEVSVRVLGIDAPEMRAPRPAGDATRSDAPPPTAECGAVQARDRARALLLGQDVTLEQDPEQPGQDQWGRLLRYVSVHGTDLAGVLLQEGLVWVFEDYPVQRTPSYRSMQQQAADQELGGWAVCGWGR